jgi:dTDP-4-dehydrorhamnose 3,5-epimerase
MRIRPLSVPDSYLIEPDRIEDSRGCFYEGFRYQQVADAVGRAFDVTQVNYSVSRRGVLRGLHGVLIPPGQAKIVTCQRGVLQDIVVDIRLGSPTFGQYSANVLDADSGRAVFVAEGLGHGFVALSDDVCISYFCSTEYLPGTQLDINPLDPELGLPWDRRHGTAVVSPKDACAPSLAQAAAAGLLPSYAQCRQWYAKSAATATHRQG